MQCDKRKCSKQPDNNRYAHACARFVRDFLISSIYLPSRPLISSVSSKMMAHELPLQPHGSTHSGPVGKTKKSKVHQSKVQIPKELRPDLGPGKTRTPKLPNGEKPDFGTGDRNKKDFIKPKKVKKPASKKSLNGSEGHETSNLQAHGDRKLLTSSGSSGKNADCYAGSSFHSSPEAVALPKPSFAGSSSGSTSPSQAGIVRLPSQSTRIAAAQPMVPNYISPAQQPVVQVPPAVSGRYNLHPAFVYQGVPGSGPPQYPITSYSIPHKQEYSYRPMMPQFPVQAGPTHPHGPYSMALAGVPQQPQVQAQVQAQVQVQAQSHHTQHPQYGQRISFNELIGSSK